MRSTLTHHLHRHCLLQFLPPGSPDDASEPAAHLRLLRQLLLEEKIPKHFNIIEKNGENAMSCNVFPLKLALPLSVPGASQGQKRQNFRFWSQSLAKNHRTL